MNLTRQINEDVWRNFVDNHPQGNIFHTPEMFQVFAQTKGHRPTLWAVVDNNLPLALFLPVNITLIKGVLQSFTTRSVVYGSVLCAPDKKGEEALSLLLKTYKQEVKHSTLFTELRNLSNYSAIQSVLDAEGFVYEGHLNYLIDLNQPVEAILQNIGSKTRKKIRKALRDQKVQVSEVTNQSELAIWYETLEKTYSNAQVPLASRTLFEAAFKELYSKGMAKFLMAKVDGIIAACSVELPYKDVIYGWYGGSDRAYSKYYPNEMLIWHILEWGANNGYRLYDFGGAGKPNEEYGVREFKAKFGGELVNFGRNICIHSPGRLKISETGYKLYRRFL